MSFSRPMGTALPDQVISMRTDALNKSFATMKMVRNPDGTRLTVQEALDVDVLEASTDGLVVIAEFGEPMYPGLRTLGDIRQGGNKPSQVVIKGENHHVLELLRFSHAGKIDCIYIDPPYNTGARDWKYDNDYVDGDDKYRHSKWLAFMERRLVLAKSLLNPDDLVSIVTIDEKECVRLGMLLEQVFPGSMIQMLTSVINPKGASLGRDFARVDEHLFVVYIGSVGIRPEVRDMLDERKNSGADKSVKWSSLIRGGAQGFLNRQPWGLLSRLYRYVAKSRIQSFGKSLGWGEEKSDVAVPDGTVAVWPPQHPSGVEGRWGISPETASELLELGALRLGKIDPGSGKFPMSYLSSGIMEKVAAGEILTTGRRPDGTLMVEYPDDTKITQPKTVWHMQSHNAGEYGSKLVSTLLPGRNFRFQNLSTP